MCNLTWTKTKIKTTIRSLEQCRLPTKVKMSWWVRMSFRILRLMMMTMKIKGKVLFHSRNCKLI